MKEKYLELIFRIQRVADAITRLLVIKESLFIENLFASFYIELFVFKNKLVYYTCSLLIFEFQEVFTGIATNADKSNGFLILPLFCKCFSA